MLGEEVNQRDNTTPLRACKTYSHTSTMAVGGHRVMSSYPPGLKGIAGMGVPTVVALTLAQRLMSAFSCLCTVKRRVDIVSRLG